MYITYINHPTGGTPQQNRINPWITHACVYTSNHSIYKSIYNPYTMYAYYISLIQLGRQHNRKRESRGKHTHTYIHPYISYMNSHISIHNVSIQHILLIQLRGQHSRNRWNACHNALRVFCEWDQHQRHDRKQQKKAYKQIKCR